MKKIILLIIITIMIISCNYKKDKLKIVNNTKKEIYFLPLMKRKLDSSYQRIASSGIVEPKDFSFAILQKTGSLNIEISKKILTESIDKTLYLVFYFKEDAKKIHQISENELISNHTVQKYTLDELNKSNWEVVYDGK